MLASFHFQQPYWLLLLPLFAVLGYGWLRHKRNRSQYWSEVCDPALLPLLVKEGQARSTSAPAIAVLVAVLLSVAAAQPVWKQQPVPAFKQGGAVVIALDLSASMNATDIKPSRLQRAHFKIEDLLGRLPDSQVALLVYAGDAFVVTPLTEDTGTILAQLPVMTPEIMPTQGSRADRALAKAGDILAQAGVRGGTVLLVSDEVNPAQIAASASRLAQQGRSVSILAVGTAQGAPIPTQFGPMKDRQGQVILARTDMQQMREAASLGGGTAVQLVADESDLSALITTFSTGQREEVKQGSEVVRWVAEGPWFVLLALPLLLPLFRRGIATILLPALCFSALSLSALGLAPNAEAGIEEAIESSVWQNLWKTADQQAAEQYQAGDKAAAAQTFSDARWKQVAQYEAQDYAAAIESLPEPETAADWYNRGNVLAQQQQLDEAIAAYEQALQKDPKHENAMFNKQLLEKQKQQQKEQDNKQNQQDSKDKSQQDSEQKKQQNSSQQQGQSDQQDQQGQQNSSADNSSQGDQDENNASAETPQQSESSQKDSPSETPDQTTEQAQDAEAAQAEEQQRAADYLKQQMDKAGSHDGQAASRDAQEQSSEPISESEQARQQLLNRIVDDPAGLWRRKFMYQYRQQAEQHSGEEKAW